jgi:hypothetical protein
VEARNNHEAFIREQHTLASQIATVLDVPVPHQHRPSDTICFDLPNVRDRQFYGGIRVSGSSVSVEIRHMTAEQGLKLVALLKTI